MYYGKELAFSEFVDMEVRRNVEYWGKPLSLVLPLCLNGSPCLKEALFLQALLKSENGVEDLVADMRQLNTEDIEERNKMADCWETWFEELKSANGYGAVRAELEAPDGDRMIEMRFPVRCAKYADNWKFVAMHDENLVRANESMRRAIKLGIHRVDANSPEWKSFVENNPGFVSFLDGEDVSEREIDLLFQCILHRSGQ